MNYTEGECKGGAGGEVCGSCHLYGKGSLVFGGWLALLLADTARSWEKSLKLEPFRHFYHLCHCGQL